MDFYVVDEVVRFLSPDAVEHDFVLTAPNGVKTIYPNTRSVRWTPTQVGLWGYEWAGQGAGEFTVQAASPTAIDLVDEQPSPQVAPGGVLRTSSL